MNPDITVSVAGPPVLVTLATGLMIAFAVQLLLTSFGVAVGITAIGFLPSRTAPEAEPDEAESDQGAESPPSTGRTVAKIGFAVGFGSLLTVNTVLFIASFMAVKLSLVSSVAIGAILGVVIWSGYFLILAWLGSSAVGSLLGSVASTLTAGVQGLIATLSTVFGRNHRDRSPADTVQQRLADTESSMQQLQQEVADVRSDRGNVEAIVQDYLNQLEPPQLDLEAIRHQFADALKELQPESMGLQNLAAIDRPTLIDLVSSRTDFSKQAVHQIVDELEAVWQQVSGRSDALTELTQFLQTASPEALTADQFRDRLHHLQAEAGSETGVAASTRQSSSLDPKQLMRRLVHTVRQRVDLSDLDIGRILQHLQTWGSKLGEAIDPTLYPAFDPIQADIEDYLLNAYPWHLTHKTVQLEFRDVIYDPEANPIAIRRQLADLDRDFFVALLQQREDLSASKIHKIADRLEEVRQEVLEAVQTAEANAQSQTFLSSVGEYLHTAKKSALKPTSLHKQFKKLLQATEPDIEQWQTRLQSLSLETIESLLSQRDDLDAEARSQVAAEIQQVCEQLQTETQIAPEHWQREAVQVWHQLEEYVRDRHQKLTARTIQRQLKAQLQATKTPLPALQKYLPRFDPEAVAAWLAEREDLSHKRRNQLIKQLEKEWNRLLPTTDPALSATKSSPNTVLTAIGHYLQQTDWSTVPLADLPQDFLKFLNRHQIHPTALGSLRKADWKALANQFEQRTDRDLTDQQRQQILQQIQAAIYQFGQLPRRFALRTQAMVQSGQAILTEFLSQSDREDLNPESLQRTLNQLLNTVQSSFQRSSGPLFGLERADIVNLLVQRSDLPPADAEQIVSQVESTWQQWQQQVQTTQHELQQAIGASLNQFRQSLNELELPALDYDRLKQDFSQLLADPQGGLEVLHDRLHHLNRDALTTLLSSRDDISTSLAQQITDRIDAVRLAALQQVEHLQQQAQQQVEALKQQAQQRAQETRKAVAIAAWWLFGTALTSVTTAAIAGALAVGGIDWVPWP